MSQFRAVQLRINSEKVQETSQIPLCPQPFEFVREEPEAVEVHTKQ